MKLTAGSEADLKARPKPFTFYPPKTNRFLIRLVQKWIKRSIRRTLRVTEIEISDDDLERLRRLKGERCLVTPSHSGGFEPHILMYLSKLLRDEYNYVAGMPRTGRKPCETSLRSSSLLSGKCSRLRKANVSSPMT